MSKSNVKVTSKNQSGGQTAHTVINSSVTNITNNIYAINGITLNNETQELIRMLNDEYNAQSLSDMLHGAWVTIKLPGDNPDKLPQAAHSIREFMEKSHDYLVEVPVKRDGNGLKSAVISLNDKWTTATNNTKSINISDWSGTVDSQFQKILKALGEFFATFSAEHRPRRAQHQAVLKSLDGSGQPLPKAIMEQRLKLWSGLDDFFKDVAHHQKTTTIDALANKVSELENLILNAKYPERSVPIEVLAALDSAIAEGENI